MQTVWKSAVVNHTSFVVLLSSSHSLLCHIMEVPSWRCVERNVWQQHQTGGLASRHRWLPPTSRKSSLWETDSTSGWLALPQMYRQCKNTVSDALEYLIFNITLVIFLFKIGYLLVFTFLSRSRSQRLKFRLNLYELKEGRQIKPKTFMSMVSNLLYERR